MHLPHRPALTAFALKTVTAAVAGAVLLSPAASAAGLGKLTVLSALGQPLRAEIELTTTAGEDASSLAVKLASPEAFRAANIEFNPALLSLRFNVETRAGRQFIRLSSTQPLNEPFVDMLLELSWNNGRLVREYTFLLDPAELRATQPAQVAAETQRPAAAAAPAPAPVQPRAATPQPAAPSAQESRTAPPAPRAAPAVDAPSSYRVRQGDTLSKIATKLKPADISLDMMLVSLYRANPDAFIGNNMNRLKSGQILAVPDAGSLRGGGEGEANAVVVAHAADFNAYRNKLAGQVASAAPQRTPQASQSAAGKITAKVEERATAANESQDQLRLSKATQATAGAGGDTANAEDRIARERELALAQARVKELERNVSELETLMTVKSRTGSDTQNAAAGAAAGVAAGAAADKLAGTTPAPAVKPADKAAVKPKKKAKAEEKTLADTLMDNINLVAAGAAVLLLAAFGLSRRKKKKDNERILDAEPSVLGVPTKAAHSLFAEAGGQSVDTSNSVFNSSFAPSASQLDTNEVDPVAEADVYIAYGRDAQAEEILKEALRNQPERHPVRLKLLEIYAARKDLRAFETQAGELFGITRGQGDEWAQAAALGQGIDPTNPMYASATGAAPVAPAPSAQERDQQSLLSQQLEGAFRSGAPAAAFGAGAATGALAGGAAYAAMDHDATAVPVADAVAEGRADDNALDFDLGGLTFEPVSSSEPIAMGGPFSQEQDETAVPDLEFALDPVTPADITAAPAPASEEPFDLAFDMSFGEPEAPQAQAGHASMNAPGADVDMAGLAAEFDLPPLPAVNEDEVPMAGATFESAAAQDPLFDLDMMDFGLPATPAAPAAVAEATPFHEDVPAIIATPAQSGVADDPLFDLDTMDFGSPADFAPAALAPTPSPAPAHAAAEPFEFDAPPAAQAPQEEPLAFDTSFGADEDPFALPDMPMAGPAGEAALAPAAPSFDLTDIDLELPAPGQASPPDVALPEPGEALEPAAMSPEHMEMETKLDLAIAYQEIGDKEGARELLDEVIKGGSSEQVSKASAMRSLLA
ncbi:FimV/HubP family polar landmark protein [Telluria aromaticivorans]|uniref:LysM peptidoglycan-binding domain-containing protein n=1 Tax=Telluria aromaticivorans TaxID=2725995 RepID=A0A7Y2JWQ1_9BURK|nr:FimV/HubP family polar landmark protein [Telluria aromaticivorans]NNG22412.1 LysM peptidoglycan-binding domain-containing protein [Telluria aromaticivorans]